MTETELTVKLPPAEIEFLRHYALGHGTTVEGLLDRYVKQLRRTSHPLVHPEVIKLTGLVDPHLAGESEYRRHLLSKHK